MGPVQHMIPAIVLAQAGRAELLAQAGQGVASRAAVRKASAPWKLGASVSTDRQAAPPAS